MLKEAFTKGKVKITCSRFLTNRNRIYNTSLSHKQEHEFALVSIGKKVPPRYVCGFILIAAYSVIRLTPLHYSQVFVKGKFEKMGFC